MLWRRSVLSTKKSRRRWRDGQGVMASRSFTPDRIKTVHWKDKVHPRVGGKKES